METKEDYKFTIEYVIDGEWHVGKVNAMGGICCQGKSPDDLKHKMKIMIEASLQFHAQALKNDFNVKEVTGEEFLK